MKHIVRILGVIAVSALTVFTMSVCDDGGNKGASKSVTYSGKANGVTYTLLITEDASSRAAYEPLPGDKYELKAGQNKSTGRVQAKSSGTLTLKPDKDGAAEFNATISGNNLTNLSGTITWDSGATDPAPGNLVPSGSSNLTIIGSWTKTDGVDTGLLIAKNDNSWTLKFNDETISTGEWNSSQLLFVYDYVGNPNPPENCSVNYSISANGNQLTLSGELVNLFGGTEPWTRVN
ncbi:MAG: hypothetical protein LBG94_05005 [Treponema sp.]|jgi:hypothetical protein|nr:hypothetical protein [Treponema sp.]